MRDMSFMRYNPTSFCHIFVIFAIDPLVTSQNRASHILLLPLVAFCTLRSRGYNL
jgi:hypothetical protein